MQLWLGLSSGTAFRTTVRRLAVAEPLLDARFTAGDFTGDGRTDLAIQTAVTPVGGRTTLVTRVATSSPKLTFAAPVAWGVAEPVALAKTVTIAADIDRNGMDDLVLAWRVGTGSRLLFDRSSGTGFTRSWATPQLPGLPFRTTQFVGADWNGDGRTDILALSDLGVTTSGAPRGTGVTLYRSDGKQLTAVPLPADPTLAWGTFAAN